MKAAPAGRSLDTVAIVIGMTSIPVSIFTATAEDDRITSSYSEVGNPIGLKQYDKVTEQILTKEQVVSMVDTETGPVYVDPAEVEAALGLTPKTLTVKGFHPTQYADQFVVKAHRVIEPAPSKIKKAGKYTNVDNLQTQQQLSALLTAMDQYGVIAFGELVSRGRSYPVVLHADGRLDVVYHTEQVRAARESKLVDPPAEMVAKSRDLIAEFITTEAPDLTDRRRAVTLELAAAKAPTLTLVPTEPVPDLMAQLTASVAAAAEARAKRTG